MIYLICFGISGLIILPKYKGKTDTFFIIIALFIVCTLAGLRADNVGSDTAGYPLELYNLALKNGYLDYLNSQYLHGWYYEPVSTAGIGYVTFVYFMAKVFRNFGMLLFATEVVIVFCISKAILIFSSRRYLSLGMMIFYLMFYNVTLNMMRQWIAMALLILGFAYLIKKDKRWVICVLVGVTFHNTAVMGLIVYALYFVLNLDRGKIRNSQFLKRKIYVPLLIISIFFVTFKFDFIATILKTIGFTDYVHYFEGGISFSILRMLVELPFLIFAMANFKYSKNDKNRYLFLVLAIINTVFPQLNTINVYAWRITAYLSCYNIFIILYFAQWQPNKFKRNLEIVMIHVYCFVYWLYYFAYLNIHQTLPYVFRGR